MLDDLITSGRLVDLILLLLVVELIALIVLRRVRRTGPRLGDVLPTLVSGAFLLLALRLALTGAQPTWIAASLAGAGLAHVADLVRR